MHFRRAAGVFYFNPRPPRGGRPSSFLLRCMLTLISIHALREEGDACTTEYLRELNLFQSTPSARRATAGFGSATPTFNRFQSTPSARRATSQRRVSIGWCKISIHALREESDPRDTIRCRTFHRFQSTPSARRATCSSILSSTSEIHFNPRPPRGGRLKGGG